MFTSEIIELHEMGKEHGQKIEQEKINLSEETGSLASESETEICAESVRAAARKPDLEDLGKFHAS